MEKWKSDLLDVITEFGQSFCAYMSDVEIVYYIGLTLAHKMLKGTACSVDKVSRRF